MGPGQGEGVVLDSCVRHINGKNIVRSNRDLRYESYMVKLSKALLQMRSSGDGEIAGPEETSHRSRLENSPVGCT